LAILAAMSASIFEDIRRSLRQLYLEDEGAREKGTDAETLRRMVAKVEEYSESHRAMGLPDSLLNILKDDLERSAVV